MIITKNNIVKERRIATEMVEKVVNFLRGYGNSSSGCVVFVTLVVVQG